MTPTLREAVESRRDYFRALSCDTESKFSPIYAHVVRELDAALASPDAPEPGTPPWRVERSEHGGWDVVSGDTAESTTFDHEDDAQDLADALNEAFERGRTSVPPPASRRDERRVLGKSGEPLTDIEVDAFLAAQPQPEDPVVRDLIRARFEALQVEADTIKASRRDERIRRSLAAVIGGKGEGDDMSRHDDDAPISVDAYLAERERQPKRQPTDTEMIDWLERTFASVSPKARKRGVWLNVDQELEQVIFALVDPEPDDKPTVREAIADAMKREASE